MENRKFKKIFSFMLAMVMLIIPLSSTAKAIDEQTIAAEMPETEAMPLGATSGYYDGLWTLCNAETGRYIDLDDGSSNHLEQRSGGTEASQKWVIMEVTDGGTYDGYYTITNLENGLYMTVENNSSASGTNVIAVAKNNQSGQYWRIELLNGHRVFTPACAESTGCVLSVGTGLNVNGVNIVIKEYANDTSYKDEWNIDDVSIILNSNILYDPNTLPMATSLMRTYYNAAIMDIWTTFGIYFQLVSVGSDSQLSLAYNDPTYSSTGVWGCSANASAYDDIIICDENCGALSSCETLHHHGAKKLNSYSLDSYLYTCRIIAYNMCYYKDGDHTSIGGLSTPIQLDNGEFVVKDVIVTTAAGHGMSYLIQHELSHNIGTYDHNVSSEYCVMTRTEGYWCSNCRAKIVAWIQANS